MGPAAEGTKTEGHPSPKAPAEVHSDLVKNSTDTSAPEQCDPAHDKESRDAKEIYSLEPHQVS